MTREEFESWYDTLNQDDKLEVMHLIADENIDLEDPEEATEKVRDTIRDKFYGKHEHKMSREYFRNWLKNLDHNKQRAVEFLMAEYIYGEDHPDDMPGSELRKIIYDKFPEWH